MKNQNGFATFEIILATAIISILAFVAVPKIDRVIDKILLDYEMKRLCSEIEFASSLNRSAQADPAIFNQKVQTLAYRVILDIDESSKSWQLSRNGKILRDRHYLPQGMKIHCSSDSVRKIQFSPNGIFSSFKPESVGYNSKNGTVGTITLISRYEEKAEIIFDSVGRWRGNRNVE